MLYLTLSPGVDLLIGPKMAKMSRKKGEDER